MLCDLPTLYKPFSVSLPSGFLMSNNGIIVAHNNQDFINKSVDSLDYYSELDFDLKSTHFFVIFRQILVAKMSQKSSKIAKNRFRDPAKKKLGSFFGF